MSMIRYTKKEFHEFILFHIMEELSNPEWIDDEEDVWKEFMIWLKGRNARQRLERARPKFQTRVRSVGKLTQAQLSEGLEFDDPVTIIT